MATSSLFHDFVIEGEDQVNLFIEALEQSARDRPDPPTVKAKWLKGDELKAFVKRQKEREKANGSI